MESGLGKKQTIEVYFSGALPLVKPWSLSHSPECHEPSFLASLLHLATVPGSE